MKSNEILWSLALDGALLSLDDVEVTEFCKMFERETEHFNIRFLQEALQRITKQLDKIPARWENVTYRIGYRIGKITAINNEKFKPKKINIGRLLSYSNKSYVREGLHINRVKKG